jgi:preprotein translocase subunit SecE
MTEKIKIAVAVLLAAAGVSGFYYLDQNPMILRVAAVLAGFAAGAVVFLWSEVGQQFRGYSQESVAETKKVVWPTRKETLQTTGVVFAFVMVMAIFLWAVDSSLLWIVKKLLGQS